MQGRECKMENHDYFNLWVLFRSQMARKAAESSSTEVQDHYNQVLQDMAILEGEVFLER